MLEDDSTNLKNKQLKDLQLENKRLAQEKKKRDEEWRKNQEAQNQSELANTVNQTLDKESKRMTGYLQTM